MSEPHARSERRFRPRNLEPIPALEVLLAPALAHAQEQANRPPPEPARQREEPIDVAAIVAALEPHYLDGQRHKLATAWGGYGAKQGVRQEDAVAVVAQVAAADPDGGNKSVERVRGSYATLADGHDVAGYTMVRDILPADALEQLARLVEPARPHEKRRGAAEPTLTDTGNSTRLVRLHGEQLHYIAKWDKWLVWGGWVWQVDDGAVRVRELAKDVGRSVIRESAESEDKKLAKFGFDSLSSGRIGSMANLARGIDGIPLDHGQLDTQPYLFGVANGVVDLRTGELRDADPGDLMSMQAPTPYNPAARAPRFEQALQEWFPDPDVCAYVQRVVGAALVGAQRDHVFVIHYGGGGNGKGTFLRAIRHALGRYCVVIHLSLIEQVKFK